MTKTKLLKILAECAENKDTEEAHSIADEALLDFINDPKVSKAFANVPKWYS